MALTEREEHDLNEIARTFWIQDPRLARRLAGFGAPRWRAWSVLVIAVLLAACALLLPFAGTAKGDAGHHRRAAPTSHR